MSQGRGPRGRKGGRPPKARVEIEASELEQEQEIPAPTAHTSHVIPVRRGISVQGTVQDAERLIVEGTVEATMIQATELSISQGGVFKGEAQVDDAEIAGTIDGTLTARGSLVVRGSGRDVGRVVAPLGFDDVEFQLVGQRVRDHVARPR